MRAIRLQQWNSEPELVEIPTPQPGPGEVLLRVEAAGLCHSDLLLMDCAEGALPYALPFTLGHETAGTVAALGPGVDAVSEGDRVLVYARWGCGRCRHCLQGMDNGCERNAGELGGHGGVDCVASDATLSLAAGAVAVAGEICYIGRAGGTLAVSPRTVPFECSVRLPSWGTLTELVEVVALARSRAIGVEVQRLPLEHAIAAYRSLERGEIRGRAVADPRQRLDRDSDQDDISSCGSA